jgi:hypothetical protein
MKQARQVTEAKVAVVSGSNGRWADRGGMAGRRHQLAHFDPDPHAEAAHTVVVSRTSRRLPFRPCTTYIVQLVIHDPALTAPPPCAGWGMHLFLTVPARSQTKVGRRSEVARIRDGLTPCEDVEAAENRALTLVD